MLDHTLSVMLKSSACLFVSMAGGPTMAMIALKAPDIEVVVVDINESRIAAWNSDSLPIYEPGLEEVVKEALGRNLFFSTEVKKHVAEADIVFVRWLLFALRRSIAVPTKPFS